MAYGKAKACVLDQSGPLPPVPLQLRNASTKLMKSLGESYWRCESDKNSK